MKTWTTADGRVCWPQHLLPQIEFLTGPVRVLTFGYAAGQPGTEVDLDVEGAAWQLIHEIENIRSAEV